MLVKNDKKFANPMALTKEEMLKVENEESEVVEAALLISVADRHRFGRLKDNLANNYLLGTDQYPDTYKKTLQILGNYQTTRSSLPYRASPNNTGVAFLQQGCRGG